MTEGLKKTGYWSEAEWQNGPGIPSEARRSKGAVAVIECLEAIPCNPCESSCRVGAIEVGSDITTLPKIIEDKCVGCLTCAFICPGQAIFLVDESLENGRAEVTMPYEFLPLPEKGQAVTALDRSGNELGPATVAKVRQTEKMDRTALVTIEVPREWSMLARAFRIDR